MRDIEIDPQTKINLLLENMDLRVMALLLHNIAEELDRRGEVETND